MQTHQTFDPTDPALVAFMEEYLSTALQEQVREQMEAFVRANEHRAQEFSLLERIVRVEEELRSLRELDAVRFDAMEKRFAVMDTRFTDLQTSMDKRFEAIQKNMDKRFEQMDKRFTDLQTSMDKRFEQMDKRFEQMDKRFEALTRRLDRFMFWSLGLTISVGALVITLLR